jgi:DNA-binding transcriptional LysR family regulator
MEGMGALLVPRYSVLGELERGGLVALFPAIRPAEDRFSIYQKKVKAGQEKQKLLTRYLQSLSPAEFGS